jgi:TonB family protein
LKYLILAWLVGAASIPTYAQDTLYLNADWEEVSGFDEVKYKRIQKRLNGGWYVEDYYHPSGILQMAGSVSSLSPAVLDGYAEFYHENGKKQSEGNYRQNKPIGVHKTYFPSGQIKSEIDYREDDEYVVQVWLENGTPQLKDGRGNIETLQDNGNKVYELYRDYALALSYTVRKQEQDTVYAKPEVIPDYSGGMVNFYRTIRRKLKYPKPARRKGIEGVVYVKFVVNPNGEVSEVETVKGIGGGCDQESERVIRETDRWKPGTVDNKPVKSIMVLPITFKLT